MTQRLPRPQPTLSGSWGSEGLQGRLVDDESRLALNTATEKALGLHL